MFSTMVEHGASERISAYLAWFEVQQPGWIEERLRRSEWGPGIIAPAAPNVQFGRHCVRLLNSLAKARARGRMSPEQVARYNTLVDRFRGLWPLPGDPRPRPELIADLQGGGGPA